MFLIGIIKFIFRIIFGIIFFVFKIMFINTGHSPQKKRTFSPPKYNHKKTSPVVDDNNRASPKRTIPVIHTKIAGVSHTNPDGSSRQDELKHLSKGDFLIIERDRNNPYDTNAIKILKYPRHQLGFVPRELAARLAPLLDKGNPASCCVEEVLGGDPGMYYGCRILIELMECDLNTQDLEQIGNFSDDTLNRNERYARKSEKQKSNIHNRSPSRDDLEYFSDHKTGRGVDDDPWDNEKF